MGEPSIESKAAHRENMETTRSLAIGSFLPFFTGAMLLERM